VSYDFESRFAAYAHRLAGSGKRPATDEGMRAVGWILLALGLACVGLRVVEYLLSGLVGTARIAGVDIPVFLLPLGPVGGSMAVLGAFILWRVQRPPSRQGGGAQ
jgi:hypothetical protein